MDQFPPTLRQRLNVLFAVAMPVTTFLVFGRSVSFEEATAGEAGTPLIEPAGYAFIIWSVIYAGGIVYALVQARPRARFDPLFSRIGWWTASAFLSVSVWLVMARLGLLWMTVLCIGWMAASLFPVFQALSAEREPLPRSRYWLVCSSAQRLLRVGVGCGVRERRGSAQGKWPC